MKAILVMEMPGSCLECPMEMDVEDASGNKWQGNICRGCGKRHADKRKNQNGARWRRCRNGRMKDAACTKRMVPGTGRNAGRRRIWLQRDSISAWT